MCLPLKPFKIEQEWEHAGLNCAVVMNREQGHRCGYVRVPPGHAAHGKSYNDVDVNVHGGLTFSDIEPCAHDDGIGFWFGFDCAHSGDKSIAPNVPEDYKWSSEEASRRYEFSAKLDRDFPMPGYEHYWTLPEVIAETEQLARQLAEGK